MEATLAALLAHLDEENPGELVGVYSFGSATTGGLRPDSDIDVLALTTRSLTAGERERLVARLLPLSGWKGHGDRFPEATTRRPIELTSVVLSELHRGAHPPRRDFQYGEWLRGEMAAGRVPEPEADPDVVLLIGMALRSHRVLRGRPLPELVPPVSAERLRQAALDSIPRLLGALEGDERNVLLTLARVVITVETGSIVSKDAAASSVAPRLLGARRAMLEHARDAYLGRIIDDWATASAQAKELAEDLAAMARASEH